MCLLLLLTGGSTLVYSQKKVTSYKELGDGSAIRIYPVGKAGDPLSAVACIGNGQKLTSYGEAKVRGSDRWMLINAGGASYYLVNALGYYLSDKLDNLKNVVGTNSSSSAATFTLSWDSKKGGVCFSSKYNLTYDVVYWGILDSFISVKSNQAYLNNGIYYILNCQEKTALVSKTWEGSKYKKYSGDIVIPDTVHYYEDKYAVTAIRNDGFYNCSDLTSVTLPEGITSLGENCFYNCGKLTSVTLSEGITSLGKNCFYKCSKLTSVTLPKNITSLGDSCFKDCSSLTNITLPKGVTSLGKFCFYNCSRLTSITLPDGVTSLGGCCFANCSRLTSIVLPDSMTSLAAWGGFMNCSSLTSITLPKGITAVSTKSFYGCSSLTSITLPESITYLDHSSFEGCSSLTSITLPEGITYLGSYCFKDCSRLTSIILPSKLKTISDYALGQVKKITCHAKTPPRYERGSIDSGYILYVPKDAIDTYKNTSPWQNCGSILAIPLSSLSLPKEVTIVKTESKTLDCTVYPEDADYDSLSWSSSNAEVASVDEKTGVITANKVGDAVITVVPTGMKGISASTTVHVTPLKVSSLSLANEFTLVHTDSLKLEVTVAPEQADNKKLEWSSDNPNVATVDTAGVVTAMGVGTAKITAKATDGSNVFASATVHVTPLKVSSLSLANEFTLVHTDSLKLEVTVAPEQADNQKLEWSSDNPDVATVDTAGVVKAVSVGTAKITAKTTDGSNLSASTTVHVTPLKVSSLSLADEFTLVHTDSLKLEVTVSPEQADNKKLVWSSDNPDVATVDTAGVVTAVSVGTAKITAKATDGSDVSASTTVHVTPLKVSSLSLANEFTLVHTDSLKLKVTVSPEQADNQKLVWSSDNPDVATVDTAGVVTAVSVGTAKITAKTTDGSDISATTTVHVTPLKVSSLSLANEFTLVHTDSLKLEVTIAPEQADNKKLVWSSDNPDVAAVDTVGVVKAMSVGTATITVKTTDGSNVSVSTTVHVTPLKVSSLSLANEFKLVHTDSLKLEVTVAPEQADNQKLEWSSDNPDVATVDTAGVVKAVSVGTAKITAKTTDGSNLSASTTVHVTPLQVSRIDMTKEITLLRTTTAMIEATATPELADNKKLSWTSEDNNIATVTQEGIVKAINVGTTNITATTTDGSGISATCKVTVTPVTVNLSTSTVNLQNGKKYGEQTVTILPDNYEHKDVVWTTSGNGVTSVDAEGNITANKPGVDTIRCALSYDKNIYSECRVVVCADNVAYVGGLYYILHDENSSARWATVTSIYGGKNTSLDEKDVAQYYSGTVNIPETFICDGNRYTVKKVGSYAFNCQNELRSIYIPRTVTEVEPHAAIKAEMLNRVNVADESQLVNIGEEAFKWCTGLKRFTFDGSSLQMESIGKAAFRECTALERFTWTGNTAVKTVGNSAFYGCTTLADIQLSTSLSTIGDYAFGGCGFSQITLPASLKEIGDNIFANCSQLKDVYCYATKVPDFIGVEDPSTMSDVFNQATLHVIYGYEPAYKADSWWGRFYNVEGCYDPDAKDVKVTSITISQENVTLEPDDTIQLEATVYPTNATNKEIEWSSSNDDVAMVTNEGFVLAVAEGKTIITAKTTDGSNLSTNCVVTVTKATGIGSITIGDVKIVIKDRHLTVEGLAADDVITVVNTIGFTVYHGTNHEVDLNAEGIYIVNVHGKKIKIAVK